jgi:hypothetical protein
VFGPTVSSVDSLPTLTAVNRVKRVTNFRRKLLVGLKLLLIHQTPTHEQTAM